MNLIKRCGFATVFSLILMFGLNLPAAAQTKTGYTVLTGEQLTRIVPTSFYFAGQSAQTQMRNAVAAQIGENRFILAGLVDTSGYSTEISGKYEGFFITDSPVAVGERQLPTGAYGFGFSKDEKINFFDLSGKEILSVKTTNDAKMKRPRPLMMTADAIGARLYKGKSYVLISAK